MLQNPIFKGFNPDPAICRKGDDYYVAVSTFEWFPGIPIYHSKDMKHRAFGLLASRIVRKRTCST